MPTFTVPDMSCSHCVQTVTRAVQGVDPRAAVAIDLETKRVSVNSKAEAGTLADAIEAVGFTVTARDPA